MKSPYIAELQAGQAFTGVFLVLSKEVRQKKSGEPYLSLSLGDRSGDLDAKMWDNAAEAAGAFDRDDFVRVKGETQLFQNRLQLTVHRIVRLDGTEIDLADFLPSSARNLDEMFGELLEVVKGIGNPHLKALLEAIFSDPAIAAAYRLAPAAKGMHHAWLGGLIEHVLSLVSLARATARHYPHVDLDLLLAGVLLHDIGKIEELRYERSFSYSTAGQLLGHMQIGLHIIADKLTALPGFPPNLRMLVEHMVLSHHGELEFGSPKLPAFPEALLLHHLDNLDSKLEAMRATLARDRGLNGEWAGYCQALDRTVLNTRRFLAESPSAAPPRRPAPAPPARPATLFGDQLAAALKKGS